MIYLEFFFAHLMCTLSILSRFSLPLDKQMSLLKEATHILCQQNHANFTPDEIKALDCANVQRVVINYLQAYITSENEPDVKQYLFKSK